MEIERAIDLSLRLAPLAPLPRYFIKLLRRYIWKRTTRDTFSVTKRKTSRGGRRGRGRASFVSNLFARLSVNRAAKRGRKPQLKSKLKPVPSWFMRANTSHLVERRREFFKTGFNRTCLRPSLASSSTLNLTISLWSNYYYYYYSSLSFAFHSCEIRIIDQVIRSSFNQSFISFIFIQFDFR